jgi:hypothetical protein
MSIEQRIASAFRMSDETWARHANPWSVWTRFTALPALMLAAWSRKWLGRRALVPLVAALAWVWINPRLFDKPDSTDNWASKAVLGERVWLGREKVPIPDRYELVPGLLSWLSMAAMLAAIYGLARLKAWPTVIGAGTSLLFKTAFLGLMVRLFDEMKDATPEYRSWLY